MRPRPTNYSRFVHISLFLCQQFMHGSAYHNASFWWTSFSGDTRLPKQLPNLHLNGTRCRCVAQLDNVSSSFPDLLSIHLFPSSISCFRSLVRLISQNSVKEP